jgi:hypothetical protein
MSGGWRTVAVTLTFCSLLAAEHLHFEDSRRFYDVSFDASRISPARMRQLVLLSPYLRVPVAGPVSFVSSWRYGAPEDRQLEIRPLEACDAGYTACGAGKVDAAFLANAEQNLHRDTDEIRQLRRQSVPKPLKPVREYLLSQAGFLLRLQQARYKYFSARDAAPLRRIMCDVCPCGAAEADILENLRTAPATDGYTVTNDWFNRTLGCHDALTRKYPIEAWQAFAVRYGIVEKYGARQK